MNTELPKLATVLSTWSDVEPEEIKEDDTLDDLDVDSISRLELTLALRKTFNVEIDEEEIFRAKTVADLLCMIETGKQGAASRE
ncbi:MULTISPECIES: acyl carrier protein [Amycolatopsis]|uniref:Acyl carrier protein n=1 Tax=Amycolatopsis albidoflavus TaxID=102226 RepID=A0ABW5HSA3_9PSEU